jgi:CHRD domain
MKAKLLKSTFWVLTLFLALGFTAVSCKDDDDDEEETPANEVRYNNLTLTGAKEVPANTSPNTGTINATYNKDTNVLDYTVTWTGFVATNMHFHKGEPTVSGPPVLPILAPWTSPKSGTFTLTEAQEVDLLAGLYYINIHSQAYPGGEIRVQMIPN